MSKGSARRPRGLVTDQRLLDNWERVFNSHPNDKQFEGINHGKQESTEKRTKKEEETNT
tara:strand:- start:255 stop:431 length:177 start_codon:yes stop_codon:yes gene_type:complete